MISAIVEPLRDPADLTGFDVAFLAVPPSAASDIVHARPGPLLIDLSAAGRMPSGASAGGNPHFGQGWDYQEGSEERA